MNNPIVSLFDCLACSACCKAAKEFVISGVNPKMYSTAAHKLGVEVDNVKLAIESLMVILTEAAKLELARNEFESSLEKLLSEGGQQQQSLIPCLVSSYDSVFEDLKIILTKSVPQVLPEYKNLEWRLDVDVATRSCRELYNPVVTLKLETGERAGASSEGQSTTTMLQTDPATLLHITSELEKAVGEIRSREFQKIVKHA